MCNQTKLFFCSVNGRIHTSALCACDCIRVCIVVGRSSISGRSSIGGRRSVNFRNVISGCKKLPYFLFLLYPGLICLIILR